MAFTITFDTKGMTTAKYDEVMRRLSAVGAAAPAGRILHTAYGSADGLKVVDVWASMDAFGEFGKTLMPILTELGVDPGTPDIQPQHNCVIG